MVAHLDNSLVQNIVIDAAHDQLLKVKQFGEKCYCCNSICRDNFLFGRRGRVVVVISYGVVKTLVLAPKNIQGISTKMLSSFSHKLMRTFLCSS
jgi:hypothetical protein